jgi:hypothetical protein
MIPVKNSTARCKFLGKIPMGKFIPQLLMESFQLESGENNNKLGINGES